MRQTSVKASGDDAAVFHLLRSVTVGGCLWADRTVDFRYPEKKFTSCEDAFATATIYLRNHQEMRSDNSFLKLSLKITKSKEARCVMSHAFVDRDSYQREPVHHVSSNHVLPNHILPNYFSSNYVPLKASLFP